MATPPLPHLAIFGHRLDPIASSEGAVSVTRKHICPKIIEKAKARAVESFQGQQAENSLESISFFRTGEDSVPGAGVSYGRYEALGGG